MKGKSQLTRLKAFLNEQVPPSLVGGTFKTRGDEYKERSRELHTKLSNKGLTKKEAQELIEIDADLAKVYPVGSWLTKKTKAISPLTIEQVAELSDEELDALSTRLHFEMGKRGFAVIVWTPKEIGDADREHLEERSIEFGWDYLGKSPEDEEEECQ